MRIIALLLALLPLAVSATPITPVSGGSPIVGNCVSVYDIAGAPADSGRACTGPTSASITVLGKLAGANMNATTDQAIALAVPPASGKYKITEIDVLNCSGSVTLAAGGFYTGAGKTGTTLVAAAQVYSALTGAVVILPATLAANIATTSFTANPIYFALTTAQGSAMTCDIYVVGLPLL